MFNTKSGSGSRVDPSKPLANMPLRVAASMVDCISSEVRKEDRMESLVNSERDTIRAAPFFL